MKYVLAIAGSDSVGGAGIQADIKTITSLGAHALTAVTAVTAQNSLGITSIHRVPASFISSQIETIMADVIPDAVKIGMLFTGAAIKTVASTIRKYGASRVVLDPVIKASTGRHLLATGAVSLLREVLLPLAKVVTPNLEEAEMLTGKRVRNLREMKVASKAIKGMGPDVVVTGGHLKGRSVDLLYDGKDFHHFYGERIETSHTHGTGCVFSSALATLLAMDFELERAVKQAHDFTRRAIKKGYACGRGAGTVNPAWPCETTKPFLDKDRTKHE
jgi:hydroxymethylpyrimidine kinase/phosphomethylpyrimidine kinase